MVVKNKKTNKNKNNEKKTDISLKLRCKDVLDGFIPNVKWQEAKKTSPIIMGADTNIKFFPGGDLGCIQDSGTDFSNNKLPPGE